MSSIRRQISEITTRNRAKHATIQKASKSLYNHFCLFGNRNQGPGFQRGRAGGVERTGPTVAASRRGDVSRRAPGVTVERGADRTAEKISDPVATYLLGSATAGSSSSSSRFGRTVTDGAASAAA